MTITINYTLATLTGILQYLGPGTPMPYNPVYDLNRDGWINVQDLLQCLAGLL